MVQLNQQTILIKAKMRNMDGSTKHSVEDYG